MEGLEWDGLMSNVFHAAELAIQPRPCVLIRFTFLSKGWFLFQPLPFPSVLSTLVHVVPLYKPPQVVLSACLFFFCLNEVTTLMFANLNLKGILNPPQIGIDFRCLNKITGDFFFKATCVSQTACFIVHIDQVCVCHYLYQT